MKKFVLHSESNITNIGTYKDHFGDYLVVQSLEQTFIRDLQSFSVLSRDAFQRSLYSILTDKNIKEDFLIVNAASFDYLVFKDKFLIKNNPHLILDGSSFLAKILNLKRIDIVLKNYYLEEKDIIIKSVAEAEDARFIYDVKVNIYTEDTYYQECSQRITPSYLENKKYIFDLDTITQLTYLAHIGEYSFKNYGTGKNKGTYIFSVTGDIINPNLYEFEIDTPLKNLSKAAGGLNKEYTAKCVFTNGFLNPPIDFETFQKMTLDYECFDSLKMKIGNGGICFIREDRCMVRVVLKIVQFGRSISCGRCMPCHYGFDLCEYYINKMLLANSIYSDYASLKEAVDMIKLGASCSYIRNLANCISSTIEMFRDEFLYLIENKVTLYSFIKD